MKIFSLGIFLSKALSFFSKSQRKIAISSRGFAKDDIVVFVFSLPLAPSKIRIAFRRRAMHKSARDTRADEYLFTVVISTKSRTAKGEESSTLSYSASLFPVVISQSMQLCLCLVVHFLFPNATLTTTTTIATVISVAFALTKRSYHAF